MFLIITILKWVRETTKMSIEKPFITTRKKFLLTECLVLELDVMASDEMNAIFWLKWVLDWKFWAFDLILSHQSRLTKVAQHRNDFAGFFSRRISSIKRSLWQRITSICTVCGPFFLNGMPLVLFPRQCRLLL